MKKENLSADINKKKGCICLIDGLNIFSLPLLMRLSFRCRVAEIRYRKASGFARRLAERWFKDSALGSITDLAESMPLKEIREIDHKTYSEVSRFIYAKDSFLKEEPAILKRLKLGCDREKLSLFFKQEIARDIEEFAGLYAYACWFAERQASSVSHQNIIICRNNFFIPYLKLFYKKDGLLVKSYFNFKEFISLVYFPAKVALEILLNSALVLTGKNVTSKIKNTKPKIAVLFAQGANLDKKSDYFWLPYSGIEPERIILYFKYSVLPPSKETLDFVNANRVPWINLLPLKIGSKRVLPGTMELNLIPHWFFVSRSLKTLGNIAVLFIYALKSRKRFSFWYWKNLVMLLNSIDFYETFFRLFNVKVHFGMYEAGKDMSASNIAIELAGGVDVCSHWSSYDIVTVDIGKPHDIYFSWGPYFKQHFFSRDFFRIKKIVYSGYPYDSFFNACKERSVQHRRKLLSSGAKFIVSFFDQNCSPGWSEAMEGIYKALLEKVLKDGEFGLIIKPKKLKTIEDKFPGISSLIERAKSSNRCLVLKGDIFPNEAAQASDLAIGIAVSSTPVIEAALVGIPAITFDPSCFTEHPLCAQGQGKVIFNGLGDITRAIEGFYNRDKGSSEIGDYSFMLAQIDPFRDGRGAERIGSFMKWLLDGFDQGLVPAESMRCAIKNYRQAWGNDKVADIDLEKDNYSGNKEEACESYLI